MLTTISSSSLLRSLIDIKQTKDQEFIDQLPQVIQSFAQSLFIVDKGPLTDLRKRLTLIAVRDSNLKDDIKTDVFVEAMRRYRKENAQLFELAVMQPLFASLSNEASLTKVIAAISLNCYHWRLFDLAKLEAADFPIPKDRPDDSYDNVRFSGGKRGRKNHASPEIKTKKISKHTFSSEVYRWTRAVLKKTTTQNQSGNKGMLDSKALHENFELALDYLRTLLK